MCDGAVVVIPVCFCWVLRGISGPEPIGTERGIQSNGRLTAEHAEGAESPGSTHHRVKNRKSRPRWTRWTRWTPRTEGTPTVPVITRSEGTRHVLARPPCSPPRILSSSLALLRAGAPCAMIASARLGTLLKQRNCHGLTRIARISRIEPVALRASIVGWTSSLLKGNDLGRLLLLASRGR
jgi:hypothetical protein